MPGRFKAAGAPSQIAHDQPAPQRLALSLGCEGTSPRPLGVLLLDSLQQSVEPVWRRTFFLATTSQRPE